MVRNFLPLASLTLTLTLVIAAPAFAADAATAARIEALATTACGPVKVYDGPRHLFYPMSYRAEHETCIRLVTRSALARIDAAHSDVEMVAQK